MSLSPARPRDVFDGKSVEPAPVVAPTDRFTCQLRPQRARLEVIHHEVAAIEQARNTEAKPHAVDRGFERDATHAQWTPGDQHRLGADTIIDHFVPVQNAYRVGTRLATHLDAKYVIVGRDKVRIVTRDVPGLMQCRDVIRPGAAGFDVTGWFALWIQRKAVVRMMALPDPLSEMKCQRRDQWIDDPACGTQRNDSRVDRVHAEHRAVRACQVTRPPAVAGMRRRCP